MKYRQWIVALSTTLAVFFAGFGYSRDPIDSLPDLGSSSARYLTAKQAEQLGLAFIRQARRSMTFINDPVLLNYLNKLGNRLLKNADESIGSKTFSFYLIDDPRINAFAVPGGHIAIHTGLITNAASEAELASVLAHEIAHVTLNHTARNLESSRYDSMIALASILAAAAAGSAEAAQASLLATNAGILQRQLAYSRNFEREADANAIRTLVKSNYDPAAMPEFFAKLEKSARLSNSAPEFLLTHPLTTNRITESLQRAKSYPKPEQLRDDGEFKDIQAVVAAQFGKDPKRLADLYKQQLSEKTEQQRKQAAPLYLQYGIAASRAKRHEEALQALETANKLAANNLKYQIALADAQMQAGNTFTALNSLREMEQQFSEEHPYISLYYANALILSRHNDEAIPVLQRITRRDPNDPTGFIMLSRAYGESGQLFESYVARAQYHYLRGNYEFAIKQLDNAISRAPDQVQKSILRSRRDEFNRELREVKKATKGF